MKKIEEHFNFDQEYPNATVLIKLLYLIYTVAHYCACGFILVGRFERENENNWLLGQDI